MNKFQAFGDYYGAQIGSAAMTETLDSYQDRITDYREVGCSFIPIPNANKYYSIEDEEPNDLVCQQWLLMETHLLTVITRLTEYPFVLLESGADPTFPATGKGAPEGRRSGSDLLIVTVADVNRIPVRQMLSPYILELEAQLGDKINRYHSDEHIPEQHVATDTIRRWEEAKERDISLPLSHYLTLPDYRRLIASDNVLMAACGFDTRDTFDSAFKHLIALEEAVHSWRVPLVETQEDIELLLEQIRRAYRLKRRLNNE